MGSITGVPYETFAASGPYQTGDSTVVQVLRTPYEVRRRSISTGIPSTQMNHDGPVAPPILPHDGQAILYPASVHGLGIHVRSISCGIALNGSVVLSPVK